MDSRPVAYFIAWLSLVAFVVTLYNQQHRVEATQTRMLSQVKLNCAAISATIDFVKVLAESSQGVLAAKPGPGKIAVPAHYFKIRLAADQRYIAALKGLAYSENCGNLSYVFSPPPSGGGE